MSTRRPITGVQRKGLEESGESSRCILGRARAEPTMHDWTWFFWMSDQDATVIVLLVETMELLYVVVVQLLRLL